MTTAPDYDNSSTRPITARAAKSRQRRDPGADIFKCFVTIFVAEPVVKFGLNLPEALNAVRSAVLGTLEAMAGSFRRNDPVRISVCGSPASVYNYHHRARKIRRATNLLFEPIVDAIEGTSATPRSLCDRSIEAVRAAGGQASDEEISATVLELLVANGLADALAEATTSGGTLTVPGQLATRYLRPVEDKIHDALVVVREAAFAKVGGDPDSLARFTVLVDDPTQAKLAIYDAMTGIGYLLEHGGKAEVESLLATLKARVAEHKGPAAPGQDAVKCEFVMAATATHQESAKGELIA